MYVSGFPAVCLWCRAPGTRLRVVTEHFDDIDQVYVGTAECTACHEQMMYTRRAWTTKTASGRLRTT